MTRCRLCTSNDREALVEQLAAELWNSRRDRELDFQWDRCGPYWQQTFREFARTAANLLQHGHV